MALSGLSFLPSFGVQSAIRDRYGAPVNHFPALKNKEFILIASFGRCKFQLSESNVGLILQATVGGFATDFRPVMLSDRVFKFVVSSKEVAFHIFNLKSFSCDNYKIFFSLWGNGGAHWNSEYKKYLLEEEQEWTTVLSKKAKASQASRANDVKASHSLSGANRIPLGQHFHKYD
jgi:hypothetical protein